MMLINILCLEQMAQMTLTEAMRITSNGNVGIGSTTPGRRLEIKQESQYTGIRIKNTSSEGGTWDLLLQA